MVIQLDYYHEHPRFRCCCQFCHVRTGTFAVAAGSLTFASYFLIKSIAFFARNRDDYRATTVLTFIVAIAWFSVSIVLLVGVRKEIPALLVPFMVVQVPLIIITGTLGILCIAYLAFGRAVLLAPTGATDREPRTLQNHEDHLRLQILVGVQTLVFGLAFAFGIWFHLTVLQCYRWLKEKKAHSGTGQQAYTMDVMRDQRV